MRWWWFLALVACDDRGATVVDAAPGDAAVDADLGAPDAAPPELDMAPPGIFDAAPDGPLPDVAREGPPEISLSPRALTVVEGRAPRSVTVFLHGALEAPVAVHLETTAGELGDAELTFEPGGPRALRTTIGAPFDDDEENARGLLTATGGEGPPVEVPVVVVDVHNTVELELDEEQLAFVRASRDKEIRLDVGSRLNGRPGPRAEINLRGKGTLNCARRSFTVRFAEPTYIRDSPPLEHVLLVSLCLDVNYMKIRSSYELLQGLGLFPAWFSYAEVRYGGESQGVYLVVERPRKALPRAFPGNDMVVRRINDRTWELKRPDPTTLDDVDAFLAPYLHLYDLRREFADDGERLLEELRGHMDYDLYMRWLAVNSIVRNGDYIDEVYFYDRDSGRRGTVAPYFAVMAWDYDDIWRGCHNRAPLPEPLFYCAESSLDRPVKDHPVIREVFAGLLRNLLDGALSRDAYGALLRRSAAELEVYLRRPGVREALATDREEPLVEPADGVAQMLEAYDARRAELEAELAQ